MPGIWTRVKTWGTTDTVLATDLNAEFDNILTYFIPAYMDDYSVTAAIMRLQTDPGESGTESLATTLAGELERLRFAISEIKGTTYWYTTASVSLSTIASALGTSLLANRLSSGRASANSSQPMFLVPDGTAATISIKGATTPFVYSIQSVAYTISTNVTATSLTLATGSNNTCLVDDANLSGQAFSKLVGENGTTLVVDNMGSAISALVGTVAAFKTSTEYFLARVESTTALTKVQRGYFFSSADALFPRVAISNNDTITLMKLTWVFAKADGTIGVTYTNPRYAATAPSSPATGDYWFDMTNNYWKTYNSTTWVDATATLVGICLQDTTGTKAARSFDYFKAHSDVNTIELVKDTTTEARGRFLGSQAYVYGTAARYEYDYPRWNVSTDFDTGSVTTSSEYYCYIKETGAFLISLVAPLDMRGDRKGYYHPGETWRCVGYFRTDGSSLIQDTESFYHSNDTSNVTALTAAVASLLPVPYGPQPTQRTILVNGTTGFTQILPPAAQFKGETLNIVRTDNTAGQLVTIDGYGSETINGATTVILYVQYEVVSLLSDGTQWFIRDRYTNRASEVVTDTPNGHGSGSTRIRKYTNSATTGTAITYASSGTLGDSFTINENGLYAMTVIDTRAGGGFQIGISLNSSQVTTAVGSITKANRIAWGSGPTGVVVCVTAVRRLAASDVIRAHSDNTTDGSTDAYGLTITKVGAY